MNMRIFPALPILAAALLCAAPTPAQSGRGAGLSAEGRWGVAAPVGEFADVTETGYGFTVRGIYGFAPALGVYAGFSRVRFPARGDGSDLVDSGLDAGLRLHLPVVSALSPWLQGGLVFHEVETHRDGADGGTDDGSSGVGFEAGAGISLPLGARVSLHPSASYVHSSTGAGAGPDARYLRFDVALGLRL